MTKKRSSASKKSISAATAYAVTKLQDPAVRQQLIDASSTAADGIRAWKAQRAERELMNPDASPTSNQTMSTGHRGQRLPARLSSMAGNKRLERRVENLAANIELLRTATGPEATRVLTEVEELTNRLSVAVAMAANLPFSKRIRAHHDIGKDLDELEHALFTQALGQEPS